jgi:hypothetical protein
LSQLLPAKPLGVRPTGSDALGGIKQIKANMIQFKNLNAVTNLPLVNFLYCGD